MESTSSSHHDQRECSQITVDNVLDAIKTLKDPKGSTLTSLKRYIVNTVSPGLKGTEVSLQIKEALRRGCKDGQITGARGHWFMTQTGKEDDNKKKRRVSPSKGHGALRDRRRRRSRKRRSRSRRRRGRRRPSRRRGRKRRGRSRGRRRRSRRRKRLSRSRRRRR